jgi:hypothetical protein
MLRRRLVALAAIHAVLAAYVAALAQQWLSVSSGRAGVSTLLVPSDVLPGQMWAAAIAGALLGPAFHGLLPHVADLRARFRFSTAVWGMGYAIAVMFVTIVLWLPWMMVEGRAPDQSVSSALANAVFVVTLGMPWFFVTSIWLFAPIIFVAGVVLGAVVSLVERRVAGIAATRHADTQGLST